MRGANITNFDEELVAVSAVFLKAARENPESCAQLEKYGYSKEEHERGEWLVRETQRSFEWEREGRSWDFISTTPQRREAEAKGWYKDRRIRYFRSVVRNAETKAGWMGDGDASRRPLWLKLTLGPVLALAEARHLASIKTLRQHRKELAGDLVLAAGAKPADAPPPKDTALVELAGWYERWRLLAQRVFRQRPEMMAPYGLTPGKAPPRLRGKDAVKYGEKAAGSSLGANTPADDDDEDVLADADAPKKVAPPAAATQAPKPPKGQRLPLVS